MKTLKTWLSFRALHNALVNHCWWLIWVTFGFSLLYALHDHRELTAKILDSSGNERRAARRKRTLLWCLPLLALTGAVVAQWASDKADKEIASLGKHLESATNQQAKAQTALADLEAKTKPRTITAEQQITFLRLVKDALKCRIVIHSGNVDNETKGFAKNLIDLLHNAGYTVDNHLFDLGNAITTWHFSGILLDTGVTNLADFAMAAAGGGPEYYKQLGGAFSAIGFQVLGSAVPMPEAVPPQIREQYREQVFKGSVPLLVPGEVALTVNERAY